MTNPYGEELPVQPEQEPTADPVTEVVLNPFAGNQPVDQQPSRLGIDGSGILIQSSVLIPPAAETAPRPDGEIARSSEAAAKKACGQIAEMYLKDTDPDSINFPQWHDMDVVNIALQQLGNTPLGLGFGKFPDTVPRAWARFLSETTANYRQSNNLEPADLVPVRIEIPNWLAQNPSFDVLEDCELMDIEIVSPVNSEIATGAKYCRVRFSHPVRSEASIGRRASRSTFIFEREMLSTQSFENAINISVELESGQQGTLGPMASSIVSCEGHFGGWFVMKKNTDCKVGRGLTPSNDTRQV